MIPGRRGHVNRFSRTPRPRATGALPTTMDAMGLRIAFLTAECEPWAKTGGLADVTDALARALGRLDGDVDGPVDVFLPRYRGVPEPPAAAILDERVARVPDPRARTGTTEVTVTDGAA